MAAELRTRRGLMRPLAVAFISLLAVFSIVVSGMPAAAMILLSSAVGLAAWRSLTGFETHIIKLDRDTSPSLGGVRGSLSGEAVTGLFVALKLVAPDGLTRRVFVFRDELEDGEFRNLLAYLRHG